MREYTLVQLPLLESTAQLVLKCEEMVEILYDKRALIATSAKVRSSIPQYQIDSLNATINTVSNVLDELKDKLNLIV